jgi:hypothetical protein
MHWLCLGVCLSWLLKKHEAETANWNPARLTSHRGSAAANKPLLKACWQDTL